METARIQPGGSAALSGGERRVTVLNEAISALTLSASFDGVALTLAAVANYTVSIVPPLICRQVNGLPWVRGCTDPPDTVAVRVDGPSRGGPCYSTVLPAGWNLVSGTQAGRFTTAVGPAYTLQPDTATYSTRGLPSPTAYDGYWVFFATPTEVFLGGCAPPPAAGPPPTVTRQLPAGAWVMIGNPFTYTFLNRATVSGADIVLTYDSAVGYEPATTLEIGQGAFVYSAEGGLLTLTASP